MIDNHFSRNNHYVPRSYLKRWASEDGRVWTYRILVPNSNSHKWKLFSTKGIAYRSDLYTRVVVDGQTDEVERWLDREYEAPTEPVITKVISERRLTPDDWKHLIRFLAAQDVRTPARLLESIRRWNQDMPDLMQNTLEEFVHDLELSRAQCRQITLNNTPNSELIPMSVLTTRDPQTDIATLTVQSVAGRGLWLFSIKHLLTRTVNALLGHKWTILRSPKGLSWCTSDDPVIKLNYHRKGNYDFKGGWGSKGTEIMLPLSPDHLLYTKIGEKPPRRGTIAPMDMAKMIQQFTAEHAYRFIFAVKSDPMIEHLRPRIESKHLFDEEKEQWKRWHEHNVDAERELYG